MKSKESKPLMMYCTNCRNVTAIPVVIADRGWGARCALCELPAHLDRVIEVCSNVIEAAAASSPEWQELRSAIPPFTRELFDIRINQLRMRGLMTPKARVEVST